MWMYHFLNDGGQRIQRNMFHRIWAFSQEADDTRVVNHLKRPAPHRQPLLELAGLQRRCKYRSFPPGYTWRDLALETEQMWSEVKDMLRPRGVGGGLSLGGWGVVSPSLGVESPGPQWGIASRTDRSSTFTLGFPFSIEDRFKQVKCEYGNTSCFNNISSGKSFP